VNVSAGPVHLEPAVRDRELHAGAVLGRAAAVPKQEGAIDLLDVNATVLDRLNGVGNLQYLARRILRVGVGAISGQSQDLSLATLSPNSTSRRMAFQLATASP
jgi:hypothetical protein